VPKSNNITTKGLVRGLGLWSATAVVVGSMIGQSVFLVANDMARELGSFTKILSVWIVGGVVVLFGSFCYAELGAAMPEAGGDYVYLSRGLNCVWGFLYGWTSTMILKPGSGAIIAAGLLRLAGFLLPSAVAPIFTWHLKLPFQIQPSEFTFTTAQPLAAAMIVIVTVINYFGVRTAGRFQIFLTSLKVAAVAAIVLLGVTLGRGNGTKPALMALPAHGDLQAFLIAVVPVMLAYNGFGILGHVGGEVLNPGKNVPRAAILGSSLVIGLYLLINWVYFRVLGVPGVAQSEHVASDTISTLIGSKGAEWITLAMIVSAFGSLHANLLAGPRVPYAMAHEGVFFSFAKRVQPLFHTPSGAVIFEGCAAILLVLTGTYQDLYSFAMFAYWTFYALTAVALIRLRRTEPQLLRPYRVWGYPWTPLVFCVSAFAISFTLWLVRPVRSSIGVAIILLGLPFFYYWRKRTNAGLKRSAISEPA
jgi:basic amino acid/polyamine antiporter, APA family